jgi:hypothetical protein
MGGIVLVVEPAVRASNSAAAAASRSGRVLLSAHQKTEVKTMQAAAKAAAAL